VFVILTACATAISYDMELLPEQCYVQYTGFVSCAYIIRYLLGK
jgi:hypothetical protein